MRITVPATSANVGPGFDSVGIAVTRYLTIDVLEAQENWWIEHDLGRRYQAMKRISCFKLLSKLRQIWLPHRLKMTSEVPLARGLGSSSSVIVAGLSWPINWANYP